MRERKEAKKLMQKGEHEKVEDLQNMIQRLLDEQRELQQVVEDKD